MKRSSILLGLIFVIVLAIRLYFAFQTPYFSESEAYFTLRQVRSIQETGLPLYRDPLSFGGRVFAFNPAFQYLLAGVGMVVPIKIAAKVLPNLLASLIVLIVYIIAYRITQKQTSSLFAALLAGFLPVFMEETTNTLSAQSLSIPLLFFMVFCFMHIGERRYLYPFLATLIVASLATPLTILFILSFLVYLLFLRLEEMEISPREGELVLFSLFLFLWIQFMFYKTAFLMHGPMVVWQNLPTEIIARFFGDVTIFTAIIRIGAIPLIYGVYAISKYTFRIKDQRVYLFISIALSSAALIWLKLIALNIGLAVLGVTMAVLFSLFHHSASEYMQKTRFARWTPMLIGTLLLSLTITSIIPAVDGTRESINDAASRDDINALLWLKKNSETDAVVLAATEEGHLVTAVAERKNVIDTNYLMIENIDQRYDDVKRAYTSFYETPAIEVFTRYNVRYLLVSDVARKEFHIDDLAYTGDTRCFKKIYDNQRSVKIFEVRCRI